MTVTVDAELIEAGNRAVKAGRADSLSSWVNDALVEREERERRLRGLAAAVAAYEREHGVITDDELLAQERADQKTRDRRPWAQPTKRGLAPRAPQGGLSWPVKLVLDSGALIALERNDRSMWRRIKAAVRGGVVPVTHGGVVGQVWRGHGSRQARLAEALAGIDIRPLDGSLGRAAGALLGATKQRDVIEAALVLLAHDGDRILTSRPG